MTWGYYPQTYIDYKNNRDCSRCSIPSKTEVQVCSAQRLINWKHVDIQVRAISNLKRLGYHVSLRIAGDGPKRRELNKLSEKLGVSDNITYLDEISHEETLSLMQNSDVFLATSDRREGWGATINEAMAAGCCVVASDEMGSAPLLIRDGFNGRLFASGSVDDLTKVLVELLENQRAITQFGTEAVNTISGIWSAEEAAKRLTDFFEGWRDGRGVQFVDGPLSQASKKAVKQ